jgi:N utilization substance protein B
LQVLYADHNKNDQSINQSEKELFFSINKSYDLYHLLLLIPVELVKYEEQRIDMAKQKLIQKAEDTNPNTRFADNKLVEQIRKNWALSKYVSENKITWINNPELIKNLYNQIKTKDYFIDYLKKPFNTYEDDKWIILRILEEELPAFDEMDSTLEEQSIFWNDDIGFILSMVIKTLQNFKEKSGSEKPLMPLYKNVDDQQFAKTLYRKVMINHDEYGLMIKNHSQNWDYERIALIDILIMQLAICEILEFPSIPIKVSLNEYIEIAKDYSTSNSNTFINGILDNLVKNLKAENKIIKTGRGLIEETADRNQEPANRKLEIGKKSYEL